MKNNNISNTILCSQSDWSGTVDYIVAKALFIAHALELAHVQCSLYHGNEWYIRPSNLFLCAFLPWLCLGKNSNSLVT